jgi:hypothetical protein
VRSNWPTGPPRDRHGCRYRRTGRHHVRP